MASIVDDRGYNQGFVPTRALEIRTELRCQAIVSMMDDHEGSRILEIGCGTGELANRIASKTAGQVLGADICEPFIQQASRNYVRSNLSFATAKIDSTSLGGFEPCSFNYIVGNGILHHLYRELDALLPQLSMLLMPKGRLIFWEPNLLNPYVYLIFKNQVFRKLAKLEPDEMAFTAKSIRRKLLKSGFQDVNVECRDFLLPNTPSFLIRPTILLGKVLESCAATRWLAQSVFINATKM